ncbi:MAG: class I SAM-dependent methyltransferase [Terrimicrobiaceae bacterium]
MKRYLDRLKPVLPGFVARLVFEKGRVDHLEGRSASEIFRDIYRLNAWGSAESKSGSGSTLSYTAELRNELPEFLQRHGVRSMVDIPCGDFNWMRRADLSGVHYTGLDVVPELIAHNRKKFGGSSRTFAVCDILSGPPPCADLVFCRDLLIHFSYRDALAALRNMVASGSTWLLTTTYRQGRNRSEPTGGFYRINLEETPFLFSPPEAWLADGEGKTAPNGRTLGLWKLAEMDLDGLAGRIGPGLEVF